jgi:hypothetical protein
MSALFIDRYISVNSADIPLTHHSHTYLTPPSLPTPPTHHYHHNHNQVGSDAGGWSKVHELHGPILPGGGSNRPVHILAIADMSAVENDGGHGGVHHELAREVERNKDRRYGSGQVPASAAVGGDHEREDDAFAASDDDTWHYDVLLHAGDLARCSPTAPWILSPKP